jgi:transcriptional regulator with XRE-family HTH domain
MNLAIPAEVLKHVREARGLSQTTLAKNMGTVASVLSKLEKVEDAEPEMAERYLSAIDSELAQDVRDYYSRPWHQESPPSYLHPDREALWEIDQALGSLEAFEAERDDPILRSPIALLRSELNAAEAYLKRRDHIVAWIGDIGVGKTTALTHAVGLLVGDGRSGRKPAFPVGPGRTTVCETAIRVAPTFGILVDTISDEEVIRLTRDLVSSLAPNAAGVGVSSEIARVLRNMSNMRTSTIVVEEEVTSTDPIVDLLGQHGIDEVTDRLVGAMKLADRSERQLLLPEGSEDGLTWVSRLVSNINSGTDARFGVPERITVLMPSKNLSADGQILQVVDTRGIENVTQREDLARLSEDRRALMVLCTKFADAPNATVQRQLQEGIEEASGASERQCILVLPRGDEALEVAGFDEPVATRAQGYAMRRKEVEQALINANIPSTPIYFFDARNDDPDKMWATLRGQISAMRAVWAGRAHQAAVGVVDLRENVDNFRAREAARDVEQEVKLILHMVTVLPPLVRPAHQNLIDQMTIGHHSSIAAAIVRRGDWDQFQFAHILGQGVRIDAHLRTSSMALRVEHKLDELVQRFETLPTVVQSLQVLRARLNEQRQEFLATARLIGRDAYDSLLDDHSGIWNKTAERYGQGAGYKRDVAAAWREWFETEDDVRQATQVIHERLQDAWWHWVIEPLFNFVQAENGEEAGRE